MTEDILLKEVLARENLSRELRARLGLLSEQDLVIMLDVSEATAQMWRSHGGGPKYTKLGRSVFYRIVDVHEWIDAGVRSYTTVGEARVGMGARAA